MTVDKLTQTDLDAIAESGRDPDAVLKQLRQLRGPRPTAAMVRPCTVGDGIERLDAADFERLERRWQEVAASGRISSFIPASGAATRLLSTLSGQLPEALVSPFGDRVSDPGSTPKGLLPFHRYADHVRTAFDEHIVEAALLGRSAAGEVAAHFTVAASHIERFEAAVESAVSRAPDARFEIGFSVQHPSTDTPCIDADGFPVKTDGRLLFRPGGHGALLKNLDECGGDVVLVKNIDNIVRDEQRAEVVAWRRRLVGRLVEELAAAKAESDDRPVRVCGMVPNSGQPGGGPFWVRTSDGGESAQIVEGAQMAEEDKHLLAGATHFNPVDLALALRDPRGAPYSLGDYTDPEAVIVTEKTVQGEQSVVLEHPGLWNGGMARWRTVFVEVPALVFNPVKTIDDLLARL